MCGEGKCSVAGSCRSTNLTEVLSPVGSTPLGKKNAKCFPSDATVQVMSSSSFVATRRMEELRVGDRVLAAEGVFSEIFAFMDHAADLEAEYVELTMSGGRTLSVTEEHILFAHADKSPVLAGELAPGDLLWLLAPPLQEGVAAGASSSSRVAMSRRIVSVGRMRRRGMHAPLTVEGSLVVDGVLASSYAGVKTLHWAGRPLLTGHTAGAMLHAPLRRLCGLCPQYCSPAYHSADLGRHVWTQWILDNLAWLRALNYAHDDLRLAVVAEASWQSWAAAGLLSAAAVLLVFFHVVLWVLSPSSLAAIGLLAVRRHLRGLRKQ